MGPHKKRKLSDFFTATECNQHENPESKLERELELYVNRPKVADKSINVLKWWSDNSTVYPTLPILAEKYLCVPAKSVASERAFSCAGLVVSDRRTCLKPEKVNQLIFLKHNL